MSCMPHVGTRMGSMVCSGSRVYCLGWYMHVYKHIYMLRCHSVMGVQLGCMRNMNIIYLTH